MDREVARGARIGWTPTAHALNGGVRLAYDRREHSQGEPLLLIMGLGTSRFWWPGALCEAFAQAGFAVARYDQRDAGESTRFPAAATANPFKALFARRGEAYTAEDMADDAAAVMDALGWERAHLFGHSLGGAVAQRVGLRHPDRVLSVTSSAALPSDAAGLGVLRYLRFGLLARLARMRFPGGREGDIEAALAVWRGIASPGYPFDEAAARAWIESEVDSGPRDQEAQSRQIGAQWSGPKLGELRKPLLVLHGEADPILRVSAGRATAAAVRDAGLLTFPGVGHDLPDALAPVVANAVRENAARAGLAPGGFGPGQVGAERTGEAGDGVACGLVADAIGEPGAGDVGARDVRGGAGGHQACLDLYEGGPGAGGEARAGQLRGVDDVDVEMEEDRDGAELAEGGGDRGGIGGHAADLTVREGVALGGIEVAGVGEHDAGFGDGSQAQLVIEQAGRATGQHGQCHAAEVAAGRYGGGVEVAVGVQPQHGQVAMAALQPGRGRAGGGAVAGEHQGPGGPRHRVGYVPVQQAHTRRDGAGGEVRADGLGRGGGDREGREVLVEMPGRDDQIPRVVGAAVGHGVPRFPLEHSSRQHYEVSATISLRRRAGGERRQGERGPCRAMRPRGSVPGPRTSSRRA
jgi:pimeloyl-ACP methyl ester carboxylesterase